VKKETLAVSLDVSATAPEGAPPADGVAPAGAYRESLKVNGLPVTVEVAKA
jgi:hypothetical protein